MHDAVIVVIYHKDDELTCCHHERFVRFNPGVPVVMIRHEDFLTLPYWDYDWMWVSSDSIFYRWFLSDKKIDAERYVVFDYDTWCNESVRSFYDQSWDKRFASADNFTIQQNPGWHWFNNDYKYKEKLSVYADQLSGVVPLSGMMIRHDDVDQMIKIQVENDIWRQIFSEMRVGTVLNMMGVKFSFINEDRRHYISFFPHLIPQDYRNMTGIFHPVKVM